MKCKIHKHGKCNCGPGWTKQIAAPTFSEDLYKFATENNLFDGTIGDFLLFMRGPGGDDVYTWSIKNGFFKGTKEEFFLSLHGNGINIKGELNSESELPTEGNVYGDSYLIGRDLYVYTRGDLPAGQGYFFRIKDFKAVPVDVSNFVRKDIPNIMPNEDGLIFDFPNSNKTILHPEGIGFINPSGEQVEYSVDGIYFQDSGSNEILTLDNTRLAMIQPGVRSLKLTSPQQGDSQLIAPITGNDSWVIPIRVNGEVANIEGEMTIDLQSVLEKGYIFENESPEIELIQTYYSGEDVNRNKTLSINPSFLLSENELGEKFRITDSIVEGISISGNKERYYSLSPGGIKFGEDETVNNIKALVGYKSNLVMPTTNNNNRFITTSVNGIFADSKGNINIGESTIELGSGLHKGTDGKINLGLNIATAGSANEGLLTENLFLFKGDINEEHTALTIQDLGVSLYKTDGAYTSILSLLEDVQLYFNQGSLQTGFTLSGENILVEDNNNNTGLIYGSDYSTKGKLLDRWIPDWKAVKDYVAENSGGGASIEAGSGLTKTDDEIKLGGALTEDTTLARPVVGGGYTNFIINESGTVQLQSTTSDGSYSGVSASQDSNGVAISLHRTEGSVVQGMFFRSDDKMWVTDSIGSLGLQYSEDYSTNQIADNSAIPSVKAVKKLIGKNTAINPTPTNLTKANLNLGYLDATHEIGFQVICPNINMVYTKTGVDTWFAHLGSNVN